MCLLDTTVGFLGSSVFRLDKQWSGRGLGADGTHIITTSLPNTTAMLIVPHATAILICSVPLSSTCAA